MNPVRYGSPADVVARMPSPKIWADCPVLQFLADPAKGIHIFDDFKNSTIPAEGLCDGSGGAVIYTDLSSGIVQVHGDVNWHAYIETNKLADIYLAADDEGHLVLDSDGADQDVLMISTGNNTAGIIRTPLKGERKKFWFEARFKVLTVTNGDLGVFVGLAQPGEAADTKGCFAGDAAALGAIDYLGFAVLEGDGNDLTIVYNEAGAGSAQSDTGEIAVVADTFVRVGLRLDVDADKIHVYLDGVDQGADAEIDVTTINFPSNTNMDVVVGIVGGTSASDGDVLTLDWVRVAQEY